MREKLREGRELPLKSAFFRAKKWEGNQSEDVTVDLLPRSREVVPCVSTEQLVIREEGGM